ncbi:MAG: NAD-dependent epimerase/dehydratase family protein [Xenococcaceae cyanobacterium MO_188.B32]|nr:NAD-dependent epimerase/dehydratase family protein [Xenococcaceae cyanobacterium MO_188.B32]
MKISIIGGGYVGSAIARLWQTKGHTVTVTTTTPEKVSNLSTIADRVVVTQGDDLANLQEILTGQDVVLLCVGAKKRDRSTYEQTYLQTAKNVVSAARDISSIRQIIYTSTHAILGDRDGEWTDEECSVAPANENSEILAKTEEVLLSSQKDDLNACILRLAGIYGQGRELIKIFRSWAGSTRPGDGNNYTNWVHLDDIVNALEFACRQQLTGIYHLNSDEILTRKEFFARLFHKHHLPDLDWDNSTPANRPHNLRLDNSKIKAVGFQFTHPQIMF